MPHPPSVAQRAAQITFVLKGHLKNVQISYLRVAALLAQFRDRKLYAALKHPSLEDYAAKRLRLGRASLYRYLQIYDWAREFHPGWLAKKPKGFIPDLSDAYALVWLDHRLQKSGLEPAMRKELEGLRRKALEGTLTDGEFRTIQRRAHEEKNPLRAALSTLRTARKRVGTAAGFPTDLLANLDAIIANLAKRVASSANVASLASRSVLRAKV